MFYYKSIKQTISDINNILKAKQALEKKINKNYIKIIIEKIDKRLSVEIKNKIVTVYVYKRILLSIRMHTKQLYDSYSVVNISIDKFYDKNNDERQLWKELIENVQEKKKIKNFCKIGSMDDEL